MGLFFFQYGLWRHTESKARTTVDIYIYMYTHPFRLLVESEKHAIENGIGMYDHAGYSTHTERGGGYAL